MARRPTDIDSLPQIKIHLIFIRIFRYAYSYFVDFSVFTKLKNLLREKRNNDSDDDTPKSKFVKQDSNSPWL